MNLRRASPDVSVPDPVSGLTFAVATTYHGHEGAVAEYTKLHLRSRIKRGTPGSLTDQERGHLESWRLMLVEELLGKLQAGHLRATGLLPGSIAVNDIPPAWWELAIVDLNENIAEAAGTVLRGVRIFEGIPTMGIPCDQPTVATKGTVVSMSAPAKRPTGPAPIECDRVLQAMRDDLRRQGKVTLEFLTNLPEKMRTFRYNTSRSTYQAALDRACVVQAICDEIHLRKTISLESLRSLPEKAGAARYKTSNAIYRDALRRVMSEFVRDCNSDK